MKLDKTSDGRGKKNRAYASLGATRQALHTELTELWTRNNIATDGTTHVLSEYIEVTGTRV